MAEAMRDVKAATAPLRPVRLGPADVLLDRKPDGTIHLRSPHQLDAYPERLTQRLEHWAKMAPDRVFLAQRAADGSWRKLTYAQTLSQVRSIAQSLLQRRLSAERPIAILSGNDIEHALMGLAAMMVGIPYAPISVPYSLMSTDFGKLKSIVEILTPGLVFVADGKPFARAIEAAVPLDADRHRRVDRARERLAVRDENEPRRQDFNDRLELAEVARHQRVGHRDRRIGHARHHGGEAHERMLDVVAGEDRDRTLG